MLIIRYFKICAILAFATTPIDARKNDAILLSTVKSLTLRDGQDTTHRRVSALPQLKCVGGNAKGLYNVDVMRCRNAGSEYGAEDISWTCKATLPPEFKLGSTDVICEGYDSADDPYVLKGSCAVEYRLILTPVGEEKYPDRVGSSWWSSKKNKKQAKSTNEVDGSDWIAGMLFWLIFGGIVCTIIYSILFGAPGDNNRPNARRRNQNPRWGGGGGGGNDDHGDDDPPPPYTPRTPRAKKTASSSSSSSRSQTSSQWQPGFWSGTAAGAAAGAAAGYAAGSRSTRAARQPARGSSWFGGGGGGGSESAFGGSDMAGPSSSRHESTGFGGTRRR